MDKTAVTQKWIRERLGGYGKLHVIRAKDWPEASQKLKAKQYGENVKPDAAAALPRAAGGFHIHSGPLRGTVAVKKVPGVSMRPVLTHEFGHHVPILGNSEIFARLVERLRSKTPAQKKWSGERLRAEYDRE